jgi:iron complex transport system substrate-binding protein
VRGRGAPRIDALIDHLTQSSKQHINEQHEDPSMKRMLSLLAVTVVLAAGCGTNDGSSAVATDAPSATSTQTPQATDTEPPADAAFPVTIEHKYGETTIDAEPLRVVSVGFGEHDGLLALGVTPVAVRDWYGDQPFATWPWAQDELGDAEPVVLASDEENFEQIAALDPDLIVGISSGMTEEQYEILSAIAPTVAQPDEYIDYGTPWDVALEITGRAVGRSAQAEQVIADTKQLFADAIADHPEFAGASAAVTFFFEGQPGAYGSGDIRSRALTDLGFTIPTEIDALAGDAFFVSISAEDLSVIDTDVVVWIGLGEDNTAAVRDLPTRPSTRAFREGREIVADDLLSGAFSHASPLSFEYVIEHLVPELALAVDGDPATAVPSASAIDPDGPSDAGTTDDDGAAAASDAWSLVFDSSVTFDDKAPHVEDAVALRSTIDAYTAAGDAMGGITLVPNEVVVAGDIATVTYDVTFGGTAAYTALTGEIELIDGTWVVSRAEFCGFMASARNACPA